MFWNTQQATAEWVPLKNSGPSAEEEAPKDGHRAANKSWKCPQSVSSIVLHWLKGSACGGAVVPNTRILYHFPPLSAARLILITNSGPPDAAGPAKETSVAYVIALYHCTVRTIIL